MDPSAFADAVATTPAKQKSSCSSRLKSKEKPKFSENIDPNVSSPGSKLCRHSPMIFKSVSKEAKSVNCIQADSSPTKKKIRQRKFVIAKKNSKNSDSDPSLTRACEKCNMEFGKSRCLCSAYESLRASQEEFFKNQKHELSSIGLEECSIEPLSRGIDRSDCDSLSESTAESVDFALKRSREELLEEARKSIPEPGSGRVMHLVKAFEKLRMIPKTGDSEGIEDVKENEEQKTWSLPGLHQPSDVSETRASPTLLYPSNLYLTYESLGLDASRNYSLDSSQRSISGITSVGGPRTRTSSTASSGNLTRRNGKPKKHRSTLQKPFMLRTEHRGRLKEEEHEKKLREMVEEEEKLRIPIAQGLPWTIDEPERLVKPKVKETMRPVELILHTDVRAVERAEFDTQVAKKMSIIEAYRMEREKQQKLEEEEETRRLRKEMIPKAQPMPYFDCPFIPSRSTKQPTIPKEPKLSLSLYKRIKCLDSSCDYTQLD